MRSCSSCSYAPSADYFPHHAFSPDRYNPHNVGLLEDYLETQKSAGTHDLLPNLATLKLYQFNPHLAKAHVVIDVLLLALLSPASTVDAPDFELACSLALDRPPSSLVRYVQDSEDGSDEVAEVVPYLTRLRACLRQCRFRDFWAAWKDEEDKGAQLVRAAYLPSHPYAVDSVRKLVVSTVSTTFARVSAARLARWLDLEGGSSAVAAYIQETQVQGWSIEGDDVRIASNEDNDVRPGVIRENVELKRESDKDRNLDGKL